MINAILNSTNLWEAMQVSCMRLSLAKNILFLMIFSIWKLDIPIFLIVIAFGKSLESYKHQTEIFNLFHKLFVINVSSSCFLNKLVSSAVFPIPGNSSSVFLVAKAETHTYSFLCLSHVCSLSKTCWLYLQNIQVSTVCHYGHCCQPILGHPYFSLGILKYLLF